LKEKVKTKRRTKAQIASNSPGVKYKVMSLCANEVFNRETLSKLQCEYANAMKPFGLKRGLKKSGAHHTAVKEYHAKTAELAKVKQQLKNTTKSLEIKEKKLLEKSEEIKVAQRKLAYIQQRAKDILEACFEPLRRAFEFASSNLNHQAIRLISNSLNEYDRNKDEIKNILPQEKIQEVDDYVMPMRKSLK
jgi:chromosome segregation ATPase